MDSSHAFRINKLDVRILARSNIGLYVVLQFNKKVWNRLAPLVVWSLMGSKVCVDVSRSNTAS